MYRYVSFLRGINVGGNKIIKMEDLKRYFIDMKLSDVTTYIQTGNVLFSSKNNDQHLLNSQITKALSKRLGYEVKVFTRSIEELKTIVDRMPFHNIIPDKISKIYLAFLTPEPEEINKLHLEKLSYDAEEFVVAETEAYILVHKNRIKIKAVFSNNFLEKKLKVSATTRDWNTIIKILQL